MNRIRDILNKHLFYGIFIGMLAILVLRMGGAGAVALALSCGQWNVVSIPGEGTSPQLSGVAADSPNDVWTVGFYLNNSNADQTLTEHWNGTQWSIIPSPDAGTASYLRDVTAHAVNDVWAVGYSQNGSTYPTLIEHWNWTQWSIYSSPSPGSTFSVLDGVAAIAGNDVWAVGSYQNAGSSVQTLTEHWDGTQWNLVSSPNAGKGTNELYQVTADAANDVWAVGDSQTRAGGISRTLIEHWDGTQWKIVTSPSPGRCDSLYGVTALATNDVWAVGRDIPGSHGTCLMKLSQTLIEHWDGTQWSIVTSPHVNFSSLSSVTAVSASNVWAVGNFRTEGKHKANQTLTEQWNGTAWSVVPSPNPDGYDSLSAVTATGSDLWAVGTGINGPLTEFYC